MNAGDVRAEHPTGTDLLPDRDALESVARLAARLLRVHGAAITVLRGDHLVLLGTAGPAFTSGVPGSRSGAEPLDTLVIRTEQPLFLEDARHDPAFRVHDLSSGPGVVAYASVPLVPAGGGGVGVLSVFDAEPRPWTTDEREALADLAAVATAELSRSASLARMRAGNSLLITVIEGTTDLVWVKDLRGRYLLANTALAQAVGRAPAEIVGEPDESFLPPNEAQRARAQDVRIIETGATIAVEQRYLMRGSQRDLLLVKGPYRDPAGRCLGVFGIAKDITERRQTEEALRRSEELHRLVATVTREAIWDRDVRMGTVHRGEGYRTIFGYAGEVIPTDWGWWLDRVHPEDLERVAGYYAALDSSTVQDSETSYRWRRADGRYAVVLDHVGVVRDGAGTPVRMVGALQDISERVETHQELARSLSLLETTIESTADGLLVVGREGEIRGYNRRFAELWRLPPEVLRTGRDQDALSWARTLLVDPEQFIERVRSLYEEPEAESSDTLFLRDGRVFERYSQPHRLGAEVVGRVWSFRDVTARRQAEERLEQSRARYQQLVHSVAGIVWEMDPGMTAFTFVSPQAEQLTGYPVSQWLQPEFWETHVHPEDREAAVSYCLTETRAGRAHSFEYRMLSADGRTLWMRDFVNVEVAEGVPVLLRGIMVDITELKRTEEALHQREEQLRHAQKMEAVGRLAGGIAHDFNNLLTAIVGYSDLLRESLGDDPRTEEVAEIRRAADRAAQLTRQLLAFSRKQVLQPADLHLQEVVLGLASLLRRIIGEHIRLETVLDAAPLWIRADRGQLEQVIINLAVNARDAMPRGGVLTISVSAFAEGESLPAGATGVVSPPVVQLLIRDTGTGMDDATRAHIFEPFFTTKEVGQGTGLGLATVDGIVAQSGGEILVNTAPEAGAAFRILLPQVSEPATAPPSDPATARAEGGTETILLVEDEGAVRRLASSVLRGLGYTVIEAANGSTALAIARQRSEPIHLVLSDMVMPGMSGIETCAALTTLLPGSRFLFMSGYPLSDLDRIGTRLPPGRLLRKPFTPGELTRRVRGALDDPCDLWPAPLP